MLSLYHVIPPYHKWPIRLLIVVICTLSHGGHNGRGNAAKGTKRDVKIYPTGWNDHRYALKWYFPNKSILVTTVNGSQSVWVILFALFNDRMAEVYHQSNVNQSYCYINNIYLRQISYKLKSSYIWISYLFTVETNERGHISRQHS